MFELDAPLIMGILNVTPDSFSDGNRYFGPAEAFARAAILVEEGADIVDVGGESTRPGAAPVGEEEEIERVLPVVERVTRNLDVVVSIDTKKLGVMAAAADMGASIVNDVNALRAPGAREWAARTDVGVCLMHSVGEPRTMQQVAVYQDVVAEVAEFLAAERGRCLTAGVAADRIALDPGVGFGKNLAHNLALLKSIPRLAALGSPLLVGVSRKSFIGRILGRDVHERLYGGLGLAAYAIGAGASVIRTHDVAATRDAIDAVAAVLR